MVSLEFDVNMQVLASSFWIAMLQTASRHAPSQQQVYLDVTVDGELKGRLVIQLSGDSPVGAKRFAQLSQGLNGVGYRLSKFDGIAQVAALQHIGTTPSTCQSL